MSLDAVKAHYDAAPYQGGIHPYTHPEQLAALGRLNGLPAAECGFFRGTGLHPAGSI